MPNSIHSILIVDDSSLQREITEKVLAPIGINIITVQSGEEALAIFEKQSLFLVLMDVTMGGIDGFETAKRMRTTKHNNQSVPIIFITGSSTQPENIAKGYEAGAVDYILKPIAPAILISKVKVFLEIRQQSATIEKQLNEIQEKNAQLEHQLKEIDLLSGLVPICASCKDIRDVSGYWQTIEQYFTNRTDTEFSHSICPECKEKLYPELN